MFRHPALALIGVTLLAQGCGNPHSPSPEQLRSASDADHISSTPHDIGMHEGNLSTEEMIEKTQANLQGMAGKRLSPEQQEIASRTTDLVAQSRAATKDGNYDVAHNLASKAYTLSKDLAAGVRR